MNRDEIISMAQAAGLPVRSTETGTLQAYIAFAALVAAAEREECAILCDAISSAAEMNGNMPRMATANDCAAAIRARGQE